MRRYGMYGLGAMSSTQVRSAQEQINGVLVAQGFEPIKPDGILGPLTCGAARAVNHPTLPEMKCTKFTEPKRAAGGPPIPPPGTTAPPGSPLAPGPALSPPAASAPSSGVFGLDVKTILIGAAVVGAGVVVVYALKKKSQAA